MKHPMRWLFVFLVASTGSTLHAQMSATEVCDQLKTYFESELSNQLPQRLDHFTQLVGATTLKVGDRCVLSYQYVVDAEQLIAAQSQILELSISETEEFLKTQDGAAYLQELMSTHAQSQHNSYQTIRRIPNIGVTWIHAFDRPDIGSTQSWVFKNFGGDASNATNSINHAVETAINLWDQNRYAEALTLLRPEAELGDALAQTLIGEMYEFGEGVNQDYNTARHWYQRAAEQEYAHAQMRLGALYEEGFGTRQDYSKAFELYTLAAGQNEPNSIYGLGYLYHNGLGVTQNYVTARQFYERAAEHGIPLAQTQLGLLHYHGHGTPRNLATARSYFELAAAQNEPLAQTNLGWLYQNGYGVTQNYNEAFRWYQLAANQQHGLAQYNLGTFYFGGYGVQRDHSKARYWFSHACANGVTQACAQ